MTYATNIINERLPKHVAIIMDGNGRWAGQRNMPRIAGHREGVKSLRKIVDYAAKKGIEALTVYAFSSENWSRPRMEISMLMDLFMSSLRKEGRELHDENVKLRFIGEHKAFSKKLQIAISEAERLTRSNDGLELVIAANYGGRWDIANAFRILYQRIQSGDVTVDQVDETLIQASISTVGLPDPDLFIRTGGEIRISNFLLWQLAYTELYFTDILWPDFSPSEFEKALVWYAERERRFGKISEQLERANDA